MIYLFLLPNYRISNAYLFNIICLFLLPEYRKCMQFSTIRFVCFYYQNTENVSIRIEYVLLVLYTKIPKMYALQHNTIQYTFTYARLLADICQTCASTYLKRPH